MVNTLVLQAAGSRCVSQLSIRFFSSFPISFSLSAPQKKRHLDTPAQVSRQLFWIQTPEYDQLLSSSGKGRDTSVPCVFTFPTCQKRSEWEDYTQPKKNSIKSQHWNNIIHILHSWYHNRGSLTLGCQLFYFSGSFCGKQQQLRCICGIKSLFKKENVHKKYNC